MPSRPPRPAECGPVRDFSALFGAEHISGIRQRLRDAFARRFRKPDLLGAQTLDCTTIDGGGGQELDGLSARGVRFLAQRPQISDGGLGNVCNLDLLVRRCVELRQPVPGALTTAAVRKSGSR